MKIFLKKNLAMTLAEVMIVFIVIGIIASVTSISINHFTTQKINKYMTNSAFLNLKETISELIADDSDSTLTSTGTDLCNLFTNVINTIGTITPSATANDSSNFSTATFNFKTSNGMKFYNFGTNADANGNFFIYIDIDGDNRKSILDVDVIKFQVNTKGQVVPAYTAGKLSVGATSTDYLATGLSYKNVSTLATSWLITTGPYRNAVCTAGQGIGTYCTATPAITANTNCTNGTHVCEVVLQTPKELAKKRF